MPSELKKELLRQQAKHHEDLWKDPVPFGNAQRQIDSLRPGFNSAIKSAENNKGNFGVLSEKFGSIEEANKILNNSIENNFSRWIQAGKPMPFVDFMQLRWAPVGVKNDKDDLNLNWRPNVRHFLERLYGPEQYERMKQDKIVLGPQDTAIA